MGGSSLIYPRYALRDIHLVRSEAYSHGDRSLCWSRLRWILSHLAELFFHQVSFVLILSWILIWCSHEDFLDIVRVLAWFHRSWFWFCNNSPTVRYGYLMLMIPRQQSKDSRKSSLRQIEELTHPILLCNRFLPYSY